MVHHKNMLLPSAVVYVPYPATESPKSIASAPFSRCSAPSIASSALMYMGVFINVHPVTSAAISVIAAVSAASNRLRLIARPTRLSPPVSTSSGIRGAFLRASSSLRHAAQVRTCSSTSSRLSRLSMSSAYSGIRSLITLQFIFLPPFPTESSGTPCDM